MLRELESLVEMFVKESLTWIAVGLFFLVLFPISIIFAFGHIVARGYIDYLISGTITYQVALAGMLMVPNSLGMDREGGRISLILASGVPPWAYAIASSFVNNLFAIASSLLIAGVGSALGFLKVTPLSLGLLVLSLIVSTFQGSMIGLALASYVRNWRLLQQVTQIAAFGLTFFAPVYFPLSIVPGYLRPLALAEPTTYVAQAVRLSLAGSAASLAWDAATFAYGLAFAFIASWKGLS